MFTHIKFQTKASHVAIAFCSGRSECEENPHVPTAAKYPLPQKWQILRKHFLKLLIGSLPMIEGRSLVYGGRS